jgi:hypothetical protein
MKGNGRKGRKKKSTRRKTDLLLGELVADVHERPLEVLNGDLALVLSVEGVEGPEDLLLSVHLANLAGEHAHELGEVNGTSLAHVGFLDHLPDVRILGVHP